MIRAKNEISKTKSNGNWDGRYLYSPKTNISLGYCSADYQQILNKYDPSCFSVEHINKIEISINR